MTAYTKPPRIRNVQLSRRSQRHSCLRLLTPGFWHSFLLGLLVTIACLAQPPQELSPRELYYSAPASDPSGSAKSTVVPKLAAKTGNPASQKPPGKMTAVAHLGIRYSVLLLDPISRRFQPVDQERKFQTGDCLALEFQPNYSGYIYVFGRGSSGAWQSLFPFLAGGESNRVIAFAKVRVPTDYCFELKPPSGVEHFFLVLGRNREDLAALDMAVEQSVARGRGGKGSGVAGLGVQIGEFQSRLRDRDIGVKKVDTGTNPDEQDHSVYVVDVSPEPNTHIVNELQIKH